MKLALALALVSSPAFAGGHGLSFDEIKEACLNPAKFQNQLAPSNLQITCEEHLSRWLPSVSKEMPLPRARYVVSSLTSDKYSVAPSRAPMKVDLQNASCPSYKETLEVTLFTKATSCDEILGWKGGEADLCADILDRARQANPKIVQISDTGRVVEFCTAGQQQGPGKDQGQGQGQGKDHK